jgi:hypothetical protein
VQSGTSAGDAQRTFGVAAGWCPREATMVGEAPLSSFFRREREGTGLGEGRWSTPRQTEVGNVRHRSRQRREATTRAHHEGATWRNTTADWQRPELEVDPGEA